MNVCSNHHQGERCTRSRRSVCWGCRAWGRRWRGSPALCPGEVAMVTSACVCVCLFMRLLWVPMFVSVCVCLWGCYGYLCLCLCVFVYEVAMVTYVCVCVCVCVCEVATLWLPAFTCVCVCESLLCVRLLWSPVCVCVVCLFVCMYLLYYIRIRWMLLSLHSSLTCSLSYID